MGQYTQDNFFKTNDVVKVDLYGPMDKYMMANGPTITNMGVAFGRAREHLLHILVNGNWALLRGSEYLLMSLGKDMRESLPILTRRAMGPIGLPMGIGLWAILKGISPMGSVSTSGAMGTTTKGFSPMGSGMVQDSFVTMIKPFLKVNSEMIRNAVLANKFTIMVLSTMEIMKMILGMASVNLFTMMKFTTKDIGSIMLLLFFKIPKIIKNRLRNLKISKRM